LCGPRHLARAPACRAVTRCRCPEPYYHSMTVGGPGAAAKLTGGPKPGPIIMPGMIAGTRMATGPDRNLKAGI
jgi:hypothetical protein